ncbi:hypothetical protein FRC14_003791 [Serendipita sp. 396]|nr:hypothetical protein FRC14_003791 [Serendipita sp. 396]KAG8783646.1 hypothetical protein FRC15_004788 [Serendipita sp. 397]KAG8802742.1 hypothetical protein FRC16_008765 [Serendipita sp. 398]KAG8826855.1 hypothetical protein FRC19_007187 [Serendipita sp. 401]KAG8868727.1 hypothetical protein FRC20_002942 [Serendipita sp. 405]KAG9057653.1 hypothetical protein FS842_005097 [Serendipita sp. 407]
MPATASSMPSVPFPVAHPPHANGPKSSQLPPNVLTKGHHRHGHSADYHESWAAQKPQLASARLSSQGLSKPLPSKPDYDPPAIVRPSHQTEAQRYKQQTLQKLTAKEGRPSDYPDHSASSNKLGKSATVDGRPSSASNGHRRKPVAPFVSSSDVPDHFQWAPGSEPQVIQSPTTDGPSGSSRSRNRNMALYREPPSQHQNDTWSKATAQHKLDSRASSTKTIGQQPYPHHQHSSSQPDHFVISSASLGRHHSASVSTPTTILPGSARTTFQATFPNTPTASTLNANQKTTYTSTSAVPTPQAYQFPVTPTPPKPPKHATSSSQDLSEERRRKMSHHRAASASTHAPSPSTCSTGSSHCDTWNSCNSQSSHRQRNRGNSDAPAPTTHYLGTAMTQRSQVSVFKTGDAEDRGRKREKEDTSLMGRVRARSNSLTKSLQKIIQYPIYLAKDKAAKRESKQANLGKGGSTFLATSDAGHSAHSNTYTPSTSTTSTTASPVSHHRSQSAQPRPKKLHSRREQELREDYRASPMTRAKNDVLADWAGVGDLPSRQSGVMHAQIQVMHTHLTPGGVHRSVAPAIIPFSNPSPLPRRR